MEGPVHPSTSLYHWHRTIRKVRDQWLKCHSFIQTSEVWLSSSHMQPPFATTMTIPSDYIWSLLGQSLTLLSIAAITLSLHFDLLSLSLISFYLSAPRWILNPQNSYVYHVTILTPVSFARFTNRYLASTHHTIQFHTHPAKSASNVL